MPKPVISCGIYTARYKHPAVAIGDRVPVRITLGHPRFSLGYRLEERIPQLAPPGSLFHVNDRAVFEPAYWRHLDEIGVEYLARQFQAISQRHGGRDLVLLCFEDVTGGKDWCHRLCFGSWWTKQTGQAVPELDLMQAAPAPKQAGLFE